MLVNVMDTAKKTRKATKLQLQVLEMIACGERGGRLTGALKRAFEQTVEAGWVRRVWEDPNTPRLVLTRKGQNVHVHDLESR